MQLRRCTNTDCLRPYQIKKSEKPAGELRSGKLNCPHCNHVEAMWEDDAFSLQALTEEQEALFNRQRRPIRLINVPITASVEAFIGRSPKPLRQPIEVTENFVNGIKKSLRLFMYSLRPRP